MKSKKLKMFALMALPIFVFGMIVPMTTPVTQMQSQTMTPNSVTGKLAGSSFPQHITANGVSYTRGSSYSGSYTDTWIQNQVFHVSTSASDSGDRSAQKYPTSATDWNKVGTSPTLYAWSYPERIKAQDGSSAGTWSYGGATVYSHYLRGSSFSFSIPSNAIIDGIYFEDNRRNGGTGTTYDNALYLVKKDSQGNPVTVGTNHASATPWTGSYGWFGYGSSRDLWGTTWTYSEINDGIFGAVLQVRIEGGSFWYCPAPQVDAFRITVYYHIGTCQIDCYYSFHFADAPKERVYDLEWAFGGKASVDNVRIYLFNWGANRWDDTGKRVSRDWIGFSDFTYTTYMDADENMRIRFYLDGQSQQFTVSVDILYWIVYYHAPTWSMGRPSEDTHTFFPPLTGSASFGTLGGISLACEMVGYDTNINEETGTKLGYGTLVTRLAINTELTEQYANLFNPEDWLPNEYYEYYIVNRVWLEVNPIANPSKTGITTHNFGGYKLIPNSLTAEPDSSGLETVIGFGMYLLGKVPGLGTLMEIIGFLDYIPWPQSPDDITTSDPGTPWVHVSWNRATPFSDNNATAVVDLEWHCYDDFTTPVEVELKATVEFLKSSNYGNIETQTVSTSTWLQFTTLSPSISPTSAILDDGESQLFTSSCSGGTPPYSYQWYLNDAAVSGATDSTWTFTQSSGGFYEVYLKVTDELGSMAKSNTATVAVAGPSASISPTSATLDVGMSQLFTSTVSGGTPPYSYQWYLNDAAVSGATDSTWTFTPSSAGSYTVYMKVTDELGRTTDSNTATVTVLQSFTVDVTIEAYPTTDSYPRYHGMSVDQSLPSGFWNYPGYNIATTSSQFTYSTQLVLKSGTHYIVYGNSGYVYGNPSYAWHAKIFINGVLVAEGDVGRDCYLAAYFTL